MSGGEPSSIKRNSLCAADQPVCPHIQLRVALSFLYPFVKKHRPRRGAERGENTPVYLALYRKYRPRTFDDVVGQEHIVTTLKHQVQTGKLSHAYLFTGSRGTGKTTCSKILAKAINCPHVHDGQPCGVCDICTGIDGDSITDVVELDAASNNGVDNIRTLREEAYFVPTQCKKRVYIIDEVHMLSISAFNALLKIMEEPPEHVVFILATTEIHKLPVTILSRCQRFDFNRITAQQIADRLQYISQKEGVALPSDAAMLLGRLADGGMRDGVSLLDKCISTGEEITLQLVKDLCGVADKSHVFDRYDCVLAGDVSGAIHLLDDLAAHSADMGRLAQEMLSHSRDLMLCKVMADFDTVTACAPDERDRYLQQAAGIAPEQMLSLVQAVAGGCEQVGRAQDPRIALEMLLISLCTAGGQFGGQQSVPAVSSRPVTAAQNTAPAASPAPAAPAQKSVSSAPASTATAPAPTAQAAPSPEPDDWQGLMSAAPPPSEEEMAAPPVAAAPPARPSPDVEAPTPPAAVPDSTADGALTAFEPWSQVLAALGGCNKLAYTALQGSQAYLSGDALLLIDSKNELFLTLMRSSTQTKKDIRQALVQVTGQNYRLGPYRSESRQQPTGNPQLEKFIEHTRAQGIPVEIKE